MVLLIVLFAGLCATMAYADEEKAAEASETASSNDTVTVTEDEGGASAIDKTAGANKSNQDEPTNSLSGRQQREQEDQAWDAAAAEYNAQVESEEDEVICRKEKVVGSRRKVRVCRTVRDIEAEKQASERMLRRRDRTGSGPKTEGVGAN